MKRLVTALLLSTLFGPPPAKALDLRSTLTSPMVNWSVYQQGAVRRSRGTFENWSVTCDEITALKQKYCSLRSTERREDGRLAVYMDVSTGDNGAPVALVHLPLGTSLTYGVKLIPGSVPPTGRTRTDGPKLEISRCGTIECLALWTLSRTDIASLLKGQDIGLATCSPGRVPLIFETDLKHKSCQIRIVTRISAQGFGEAVEASVH